MKKKPTKNITTHTPSRSPEFHHKNIQHNTLILLLTNNMLYTHHKILLPIYKRQNFWIIRDCLPIQMERNWICQSTQ